MDRMPRPGEPAPRFDGVTGDGTHVRLEDYRGRTLVLYFYPKDDTPGCTKQACSLRDHATELAAAGVEVLGVSTQDERSHQAFTRKYHLNFPLLADTDGTVGRAYGTLGGAGVLDRIKTAVGAAKRVTFIIDERGRISHVIDKPDVKNHAAEVLALL